MIFRVPHSLQTHLCYTTNISSTISCCKNWYRVHCVHVMPQIWRSLKGGSVQTEGLIRGTDQTWAWHCSVLLINAVLVRWNIQPRHVRPAVPRVLYPDYMECTTWAVPYNIHRTTSSTTTTVAVPSTLLLIVLVFSTNNGSNIHHR